MKYGSQEKTSILDDNGSTETIVNNIIDGAVNYPIRHKFSMRERVSSVIEERNAYMRFSVDIEQNPSMLDPAFGIERTALGQKNGFYYIVKTWTELETKK